MITRLFLPQQLAEVELELAGLQQKVPRLEKSALCEDQVALLREQLQQEKIQRVVGEHAVLGLQDKVVSLEERKSEQDVLLKEKHHTVLTTETYAKEQKIHSQRSREKVACNYVVRAQREFERSIGYMTVCSV